MAEEIHWYYLAGDERCGPFTSEAMQQLLQGGVIQPDTNVAKAGAAGWMRAHDANGFTGTPPAVRATSHASAVVEILAWGAIPLAAFFLIAPIVWKMICDTRNMGGWQTGRELSGIILAGIHDLTPQDQFDPAKEWKVALILLVATLVLGLVFSPLHRHITLLKAQKRRLPGWATAARVMYWPVLIGACAALCFFSSTARAFTLVSMLKVQGVGLPMPLVLTGATLIGVGTLAASGIRRSRKRRKAGKDSEPTLLWASTIAAGWAKAAIVLSILVLIVPVLAWAGTKRKGNPDVIVVESLVRGIKDYHARTGKPFTGEGLKWIEGNPRPDEWNGGYSLEEIGFIDLLTRTSGDPEFSKSVLNGSTVLDAWNRMKVRVVTDGDDDGMVTLGNRDVPGKIAVYTVGWNGLDEYGRGDDVIRVAR